MTYKASLLIACGIALGTAAVSADADAALTLVDRATHPGAQCIPSVFNTGAGVATNGTLQNGGTAMLPVVCPVNSGQSSAYRDGKVTVRLKFLSTSKATNCSLRRVTANGTIATTVPGTSVSGELTLSTAISRYTTDYFNVRCDLPAKDAAGTVQGIIGYQETIESEYP